MPDTFSILVGTNGPSPNPARIGTQGRPIVWSCQGSGSVTSVTVTNGGTVFTNGHTVGNNYQMTYNGTTVIQTWDYTYTGNCTGAVAADAPATDDSPRLTNGSG